MDAAAPPPVIRCDGCYKARRDVQSFNDVFNDNGIGLCFICRKEQQRNRVWDDKSGKYREINPHTGLWASTEGTRQSFVQTDHAGGPETKGNP